MDRSSKRLQTIVGEGNEMRDEESFEQTSHSSDHSNRPSDHSSESSVTQNIPQSNQTPQNQEPNKELSNTTGTFKKEFHLLNLLLILTCIAINFKVILSNSLLIYRFIPACL